ncbi:MAG: YVTN family beta-propeller repeat-containing protein [Tannerellaceae bacterium]|nr:YVTN family beta-propeller repeat-containing protein [Tannerellaceae bacterium]
MKTQHYYTGRRVGVTICLLWLFLQVNANAPFFPTDIKLNAKGEIFFTQKGTKSIEVYSPDGSQHLRSVALGETPTGLWIEGDKMYVTTFESWGKLHILGLESGTVEKTIPTGSGACYPMKSPDSKMVYVCNRYSGTVSEIDPAAGTITRTVKVLREPKAAVFSKDGNYLFVTNYLPAQRADVDIVAACVSVIDMATFTKIKDIQLANGSNAVRGICISPDGKYVYTSHNLGRFTVPTSQLQQGWMNTSAFSVIDVEKLACLGAIVVDEPERGAAGIWTMDCTEDHIFVIHSGTHEVSIIDHPAMRKKFEAYPNKDNLSYDLRFLYGLRERIDLEGNGPRNMVHRNGKLIIPTYFADVLNFVNVDTRTVSSVNLNPGREETAEHKGEKYFNDATKCFQEWQSCNGCHPGDARTDGMNWDLMNDGVGNPKNCKSLLYSHVTPPNMISGIRANAEIAVRAGFKHIQFFDVSEEDAECVDAYLKALRPVPSPYLVNGELSEKAKEGRKVFEKFKCGSCHSGPYYTDMRMYRIGKDIEFEKGWDTPTLVECWRTAPYLFDGRAATMEEVFEIHKHGIDKKITKKEIEALAEYVNSL